MRIAVHITSFQGKNYNKRFILLKKIVERYQSISSKIDIFIHTNKNSKKFYIKNVNYICHNLKSRNPFYLSWCCRPLMEKQKNNYDGFIYSEDDILFSKKNFHHWLQFKHCCIKENQNLGFLRIEKKNNKFFSTDLTKKIKFYIKIKSKKFAVNNVNSYCGFWIYDKIEFKRFIKTKFWNFEWSGKNMYAFYGIREMSAVGWHGKNMFRYENTIIPLKKGNKLNSGCFVDHLTNNHALTNHPVGFGSIEKKKILEKKLLKFSKIKTETYFKKSLKYIFRKFY